MKYLIQDGLLIADEKFGKLTEGSKEVRDFKAEVEAKVKAAKLQAANKKSALAKIAKVAGLTEEELAALQ